MYEKKLDQDDSYLESRLRPIGITPRLRSFPLNEHGMTGSYFRSDRNGNLVICFPSAKGGWQRYSRKVHEDTNMEDLDSTAIERIRFRPGQEPVDKKTGKLVKYKTPTGCPSPLFIPRNLLDRLTKRLATPVLFVVEGELKAAAADRHGLPIVGVAGIHNTGDTAGKKKNDDHYLPELRRVIELLQVERLVFVYDSDLFDLGGSIEPGGDPTSRPRLFYSSAKVFSQRAQSMGLQAFIAFPEQLDGKLGLDDLLLERLGEAPMELNDLEADDGELKWIHATPMLRKLAGELTWCATVRIDVSRLGEPRGKLFPPDHGEAVQMREYAQVVRWLWRGRREMEILSGLPVGKGKSAHGWRCIRVDSLADNLLRQIWSLHSPEAFLDRYRTTMAEWESFRWGKSTYRIENGQAVQEGLEIEIKLEARDGVTYSTNADGARKRLGKFTMQGRWRLVGARTGYVLDINHATGRREWRLIGSEMLASSDRFRVLMLDMGMMWKGRQDELNEIVESSIVDAEVAEVAAAVGWDKDAGRWVWANGIFDPAMGFVAADEEGAVRPGDQAMLLPCAPMFEREKEFEAARDLPYTPGGATWKDWYLRAMVVYGSRPAAIAMAYVAAACCLDMIRERRRFFPILFAFGPKGQGKSTFMRSIQSFFGRPVRPVNMESGTTVAGLQRSLEGYVQIPVFLDECSARTRPELLDILKNYYDGTGGTQGVASNKTQTRSFNPRAAAVAASQHLPSHDPALVSRCVLIEFPERGKPTLEQTERMNALRAMEEAGLQQLVHQVLTLRPKIAARWQATYMKAYAEILEWTAATGTPADTRTVEIHAAMATPLLAVWQEINPDVDWGLVIDAFQSLLPLHADASAATDETEFFWNIFERMVKRHTVHLGTHYAIDAENREIALLFRQVHIAYMAELKIIGQEKMTLPEGTLRRYLAGSNAHVDKGKGYKRRLSPEGQPTTVMVFALDKLPVQIE